MNDRNDDKLKASAGQLATDIAPQRDLWPGIAEAISAPRRRRWTPMLAQAAAIILLIGASSGVTYFAVKGQQQPVMQVTPELLFEQTAFGGRYNLGPDFQDARAELASQLDTELAKLSPELRAEVEDNLKLVNQAIFDINRALAEEPNNTMLQAKLLMAYREELAVLRRVSGLTRNVMMRNDI